MSSMMQSLGLQSRLYSCFENCEASYNSQIYNIHHQPALTIFLSYYIQYYINKIKQSMYITQNANSPKKSGFQKQISQQASRTNNNQKTSNEIRLKLTTLREYVSSVFNGCSLPPLDEFLDLKVVDEEVLLKIKKIQHCFGEAQLEESKECIYYLFQGRVSLRKQVKQEVREQEDLTALRKALISGSQSSGATTLQKKHLKPIEIKQESFFMLTNLKNQSEPEQYEVSSYENGENGKCLIAKIKINEKYRIGWYLGESRKYRFLSNAINGNAQSISEFKLKGLSRFFQYEKYRRGTNLIKEDEENDKLLVLIEGECQFTKTFNYSGSEHSQSRTLKVANMGRSNFIGAEFLLFEYAGSSQSAFVAAKAFADTYKSSLKISLKNVNNFTVNVSSAYAQFYSIAIAKFKELCEKYVEQAPSCIRKNVENGYVTLLRTTKQKIDLELIKINNNISKATEQRILYEARFQAGQYENAADEKQTDESATPDHFQVKKSELINTRMKGQNVEVARAHRLEKKIQIILQKNEEKKNYKAKIENLLKQKIMKKKMAPEGSDGVSFINELSSPGKSIGKSISPEKQKMIEDLQQIFMIDGTGCRTKSISRQNQILTKKQCILQKKYCTAENVLIVHEDKFDKTKNKLFRMELIRKGALQLDQDLRKSIENQNKRKSLNMGTFSQSIKQKCLEKINRANKIKEQFMTIKSECENCHCYDNIEGMYHSAVQKDIKYQTMKTGSAWKISESRTVVSNAEEPLERVHSRTKFVSEKSASKYSHAKHLISKRKGLITSLQRRFSAPII